MPKRTDREKLLAKKPRMAKVLVVLDDDLVLAHDEAVDRLVAARRESQDADRIAALERDADAARKAIEDVTVAVTFRAMGSRAYEQLVKAHPATDEQVQRARKAHEERQADLAENLRTPFYPPGYDADTFPAALVRASCVDPELTAEDVERMEREWNEGEWSGLFVAAFDVNVMARSL